MSHDTLKWIAVHCCDVCGDHARERIETWNGMDEDLPAPLVAYNVEPLYLSKCGTCGMLACESCKDDGFCCDRRAEIEMEGRPKAGQMGLFEGETDG